MVYVDSIRVSSTAISSSQIYGPTDISIDSFADTPTFDAIAVYGSALSATQVANHYWAAPAALLRQTYGSGSTYAGYSDDPVNTATGNFSHDAGLVSYPDSTYGMNLTASYSHLDMTASSVLGLGTGWTSKVDTAVTMLADNSLQWRGVDGRTVRVLPLSTNVWPAPEGALGFIRRDPAASPTALTGDGWVLQLQSGERYEYDSLGRLVRVCEGVADWATRPDFTTAPTEWTKASSWCGTANTGQYATVAWTTNANTQPTTITAGTGRKQTFTYDASNRLIQIVADDDGVAANNRIVTLGYDSASGQVSYVSQPHFASEMGTATTAPLYAFESYTIDSSARITAVAMAAGKYQVGPPAIDVPDLANATTIVSNTYEPASGRVATQTNETGDVVTYTYYDATTPTGGLAPPSVVVTDAATSDSIAYGHDAYGRLTGQKEMAGNSVAKVWAQGSSPQVPGATPTQVTDRTGAQSAAFYDSAGRVQQRIKPDPTTKLVPGVYNDATPTVCQRLPDGSFPAPNATTNFTRPGGGAATMNCVGQYFGRETYTYLNGSDSRVDLFEDAAGQKTKYTYSGASPIPVTKSVGFGTTDALVTTYTSADNLITSTTDGTGVKTCSAYTAYKQVWFTTTGVSGACPAAPAATSTVNTYTALGAIATTQYPAPKGTWGFAYFGTGQLRQEAAPDPVNGFLPATYNDATPTVCQRLPDRTFPPPNASTVFTRPGGASATMNCVGQNFSVRSYTYAPTGDPKTATDELGKITTTATTYLVADQTTCNGGIAGAAGNDPDNQPVKLPCKTVTVQPPAPTAATTTIYDQAGRQRLSATPVGAGGARTWNVYGVLGRLSKTVAPAAVLANGETTRHTYDANGRETSTQRGVETGTAGTDATATVTYDYRGRVLASVSPKNDATAVTTAYAYDQDDRVVQVVMAAPDGFLPTTAYNDATPTACQQLPDRTFPVPKVTTNFTRPGGAAAVMDCTTRDFKLTISTYLATGATKQTGLYRGDTAAGAGVLATVVNSYDAAGRVTCVDTRSEAAASGVAETHTYKATDFDPVTGYAIRSRTPRQTVSGCADHVTAGVPDPAFWSTSVTAYNNDGSVTWQQNPIQFATHGTIDAGHVNYRTTFGYDARGRQTTQQYPDPSKPVTLGTVTTTTCYTARDEVRATISPHGAGVAVTRTDYADQPGLVLTSADPTAGYDATTGCALTPIVTKKLGVTTFAYDGRGNRTQRQTWADDQTTLLTENFTYDLANRPTGYTSNGTGAIAWTTAYTMTSGRLTATTTTNGATTDANVRRTITTFAPSGVFTQIESDLCGASATCAGLLNDAAHRRITTTAYDPLGRRLKLTDASPGSPTTNGYTLGYNPAGNISQITYPNPTGAGAKTQSVVWNLSGQATQQTYPDGTVFRYRYDPRLILNNVDVASYPVWVNLAAYTLDVNGQRTGETLTGASTSARTWTRNAATGTLDKYTQVLAGTTSITTPVTYDNAGRIASDCKGTGTGGACQTSDVKTSYAYDAASQLLAATTANDAVAGHTIGWAYTYSNHGNRLTQTVTTNGSAAVTTRYLYTLNTQQLCAAKTGATAPSSCADATATTKWTYDSAGRRTAVTPTGGTTQVTSYDPAGHEASIVTTPNGGAATTEYRGYDPGGDLTCTTAVAAGTGSCDNQNSLPSSTNTFHYWDLSGATGLTPQILQTTVNGSGFRFVNGAERITLWSYYYSNDYLGNTVAGPADNGAPTGYSPYGEPLGGTGLFQYRSELSDNGLLHLRNRSYDTKTGAFTTRDPIDGIIGVPAIANPYAYVSNSPLNGLDPLGLSGKDFDFSAAMAKTCTDGDNYVAVPGSMGVCKPGALKRARLNIEQSAYEKRQAAEADSRSPAGRCRNAGGTFLDTTTGACGRFVPNNDWTLGGCGKGALASLWGMSLMGGAYNAGYALSSGQASAPMNWKHMIPLVANVERLFSAQTAEEFCGATAGLTAEVVTIMVLADIAEPGEAPPCASFAPATPVVMANGTRIPISQVKVGDKVEATDPSTGRTEARSVTAVKVHDDTDLMDVSIKAADGQIGVLHTNAHHLFWDDSKHEWLRVDQLEVGDRFVTADGAGAEVGAITRIPGHQRMWDLSVEGIHSFYVDSGHGAVLVHNDGNTTRQGVPRTTNADWQTTVQVWDQAGYGDALSASNRWKISNGLSPVVDDAWLSVFPEHAAAQGETIIMHHVAGSRITVPLPESFHYDAHMPGGTRYNPGGPGVC